jgi:signal transduction histidine kinase
VRQAVLHLAEELSESLGARPEVRFEGPIDTAIPQHVGDHIVAVVREGLTNAGKHAAATRFVVLLGVSDEVTLQVADNGHGIEFPLDHPGLGLDNLRARATRLGGTFEVLPAQGGGTRLVWSVPLG